VHRQIEVRRKSSAWEKIRFRRASEGIPGRITNAVKTATVKLQRNERSSIFRREACIRSRCVRCDPASRLANRTSRRNMQQRKYHKWKTPKKRWSASTFKIGARRSVSSTAIDSRETMACCAQFRYHRDARMSRAVILTELANATRGGSAIAVFEPVARWSGMSALTGPEVNNLCWEGYHEVTRISICAYSADTCLRRISGAPCKRVLESRLPDRTASRMQCVAVPTEPVLVPAGADT